MTPEAMSSEVLNGQDGYAARPITGQEAVALLRDTGPTLGSDGSRQCNAIADLIERQQPVMEAAEAWAATVHGADFYGMAHLRHKLYDAVTAYRKETEPSLEDVVREAIADRMMDVRWDGRYQEYCREGADIAFDAIREHYELTPRKVAEQ